VGNAVGEGHAKKAKQMYFLIMTINGTICVTICVFLMCCRGWVITRFTTQQSTIDGMH